MCQLSIPWAQGSECIQREGIHWRGLFFEGKLELEVDSAVTGNNDVDARKFKKAVPVSDSAFSMC